MRKCPQPWLDTYIEYTKEQESPKAFNLMTGFAVLSAAVGRNVWLPRIKYTIFPNLYIIMIAASAKCRKSVAVGIGRKLLIAMDEPPMIFAQKITPEALIDAITESKVNEQCYGLIFSDELSVFLSADAMKRGIIPVLTSFYDSHSKWEYHTKGRGKQVIKNSSLSMLAATTRDDFISSMPKSAIGGGFTSRLLLVYEEHPSQLKLFNPVNFSGEEVEETDKEVVLKRNLIADLNYIKKKIKGKMSFSKEAKASALKWYESEQETDRDVATDGYFGRKHDTMFKMATILCISEGDKLVIQEPHIRRALSILRVTEDRMEKLVSTIGTTETGSLTERILNHIIRTPNIDHSRLLRRCWRFASAQDLTAIIRTLIDSGEIDEKISGSKRVYRVREKL